ncbi:MAG: dihydrofolate reductase, partial [Rhizorhabdus sp.]
VHSVEEAIAAAGDAPRLSVVGGAEIYALTLDHADRIELTEVDLEPEGDTIVPPFDPALWAEAAREAHPAEGGRPAYTFVTLVRR